MEGKSATVDFVNMVFQGTVWGCILCNVFFQHATYAFQKCGCRKILYPDDISAYKDYTLTVSYEAIVVDLSVCQMELHSWGAASQVQFDAAKEGMFSMSHQDPPQLKALFRPARNCISARRHRYHLDLKVG